MGIQAHLCSVCSIAIGANMCWKCGIYPAATPAQLCNVCGHGSKDKDCVKCGAYPAEVPLNFAPGVASERKVIA